MEPRGGNRSRLVQYMTPWEKQVNATYLYCLKQAKQTGSAKAGHNGDRGDWSVSRRRS